MSWRQGQGTDLTPGSSCKTDMHADAATCRPVPITRSMMEFMLAGVHPEQEPTDAGLGPSSSPLAIQELVVFMRNLCRCQGPAWSREN